MNNYGGYGYGGGYGGPGRMMNGGNRGRGPSGGKMIFLIVLILIFCLWWYQGGGLEHQRKYTKEQASSEEKVLKKRANKDERITSSEINQQTGQYDGTTSGDSYTDDDLLSLKFDKEKDKYGYVNLGSATFGEDQVWNAYNKENGSAWYSLQSTDGHPYVQALITSQSVKDSANLSGSITDENEPDGMKYSKHNEYKAINLVPYSMVGSIGIKDQSGVNQLLTKQNLVTFSSYAVSTNNYGLERIIDQIKDYLNGSPNRCVFYTVDPIYKDGDIVPRGLHIMAQSFDPNSNAKPQVNINYYLFNRLKNGKIDYQTGKID